MMTHPLRKWPNAAWVAAAVIVLTPVPAYAQDAPDFGKLADFVRWGGVAFSILIIAGAMVVLRVVKDIADRLSKRFANRRPTVQKFESATRFVVYLVAGAICIALSFRLDPTALTVIGGALAFAVGFAMRDLVAAFIAGITIMIDRPFQVGDRVAYAGEYGDIIKIGLRSVQMNTLDHNIVTIPNNKILTDVTSSGNYGALEMQVAMDFYIGVDQDAQQAAELIREACLTSPYVFLEQPVNVLVKQEIIQDYVAMHIKARPYVFDCRYEKAFETDVHLRVARAFAAGGILPPAVLHRGIGGEMGHIGPAPSSPAQALPAASAEPTSRQARACGCSRPRAARRHGPGCEVREASQALVRGPRRLQSAYWGDHAWRRPRGTGKPLPVRASSSHQLVEPEPHELRAVGLSPKRREPIVGA